MPGTPAPAVPVVPPADPTPTATPSTSPGASPTATPVASSSPTATPAATPAATGPGVTGDGFTVVGLATPTGGVAKALYKIDITTGQMAIKGILSGEAGTTTVLTLAYDPPSGNLTFTDPTKGAKQVGNLSGSLLTLCTHHYGTVCQLNVVQPGNQLIIGLTEGEWENYAADPNASYTSLVAFGGYGIDASLAGTTFVDVRLQLAGTPTNGLRFKVDPIGGDITYKGKTIGNYQKAELCSGADFRKVCRFVVNSDDKSLNVFFKGAK